MHDSDFTLSSPIAAAFAEAAPLLCLTIVWHPDAAQVGAQYLAGPDQGVLEVSRLAPLFQHPGQDGWPLGHRGLSRAPLQIALLAGGALELRLPDSRMKATLNGLDVLEPVRLTRAEVADGAVLCLGGVVLLCLHSMGCLPKHNPVAGLVGVGEAAIRTRDLILRVAPTDTAVLLLGETGSGKEVAARAIHALGRRHHKAMVAVNVAALNEGLASAELFGAAKGAYTGAHTGRSGLFAQAQDSTLFLDEIGNAPASVQPMLLRVLETGDYRPLGATADLHANARLIAATDQNLYGGGFNQALLRRLESFVIAIAPLRKRREDIGMLLLHLLRERGSTVELPTAVVAQLVQYDWPGNVRQLKHVLTRCVLALESGEQPDIAAWVDVAPERGVSGVSAAAARALAAPSVDAAAPAAATPAGHAAAAPQRKRLAEVGDDAVLEAMAANAWNIQAAARALGVSRPSMYKLLEAHPLIRRPEQIGTAEIGLALAQAEQDVDACASLLKTPCESLRRHLHVVGLLTRS